MSKKKDTIACFQTSDIRQNVLAQIHRPQFGAAAMLVELFAPPTLRQEN